MESCELQGYFSCAALGLLQCCTVSTATAMYGWFCWAASVQHLCCTPTRAAGHASFVYGAGCPPCMLAGYTLYVFQPITLHNERYTHIHTPFRHQPNPLMHAAAGPAPCKRWPPCCLLRCPATPCKHTHLMLLDFALPFWPQTKRGQALTLLCTVLTNQQSHPSGLRVWVAWPPPAEWQVALVLQHCQQATPCCCD
jgi:hypothetical protein